MTVTIRDVAREAGVSISTVSRALSSPEQVSETTRARVKAIVMKLGYRPNRNASGLITGRSGNIGLVVPDLQNPFFGSIFKGVQARARTAGYAVFVADTDEIPAAETEVTRSLTKQVDGVILCSPRSSDAAIVELAAETPLVLTNRLLPGIPSARFDDAGGLRAVMDHLVALGHRRISYAAGPVHSWSNSERVGAFMAFGEGSLDVESIVLGNFPASFAGGVQAADLAIASGVSAIVAFNDLMAFGIMDRLQQRGLDVPGDMSVTGFDNIPVTTFVRPHLTTVYLPGVQMGTVSADLLLSNIAGRTTDPSASPPPIAGELLVRESSGVVLAPRLASS